MCKLDFITITGDTDPTIINNLPAIKEACLSVRYGEMDKVDAIQLSDVHFKQAIRLLNRELIHYLGKEMPAFQVKPFGAGTLKKYGLNMI